MVILRVLERDDGCRVLDSIKHDFSFDSYYFIKVCAKYAKKTSIRVELKVCTLDSVQTNTFKILNYKYTRLYRRGINRKTIDKHQTKSVDYFKHFSPLVVSSLNTV